MILVDTSAWIEFFRGSRGIGERVDAAVEHDEAAWCGPIATELRRGLASKQEKRRVLDLLAGCHWLDQPTDLWQAAGDLGFALRRQGATVKTMDLLIATYALDHDTFLLTADTDFRAMCKRGVPLRLA